jgi:lipopolysaccharide transport system ATP-binding protein
MRVADFPASGKQVCGHHLMKPIVEIKNVVKMYKLGGGSARKAENFRELLERAVSTPFRALAGRKQNAPKVQLGTFWALRGVSFDINQGDVIGIIGRNGAGKSTMLKVLSRITSPTEGSAILRGRLASLLEVGTGFHPELTGRENIFLNGAILGMRKTEISARFDEIVAFAEIEKFLDTPVKYYSSGMYVRLAFAVAAHLDPEILVVDEVLAVGDLSFQKKCLGKMSEVSRGGRTVLFVSHNMAAIENLCSRAVVLHQGKLTFDGTPKEAIQYYLNSLSIQRGTGHLVELDGVGDRRSFFAPLLKRLEFLTEDDQPMTEGLPLGARLKGKVHFDLPHLTTNFNVGLGFNNGYGHRIFTANTLFEPNRWEKERVGPQVLTCEIPSFTLTPGDYSVKVWMDLTGTEADAIEDAAQITVLDSDFYGTGKMPWNGAMVLKHNWYLEELADGGNLAGQGVDRVQTTGA